jgi:tRNA-specific 2-thiouridylase
VAPGHEPPWLFSPGRGADQPHCPAGGAPPAPLRCSAKSRYRQQDSACTIESLEGNRCTVRFDEPHWAVTAGQSVVFYDGEACLGGGVITSTLENPALQTAH